MVVEAGVGLTLRTGHKYRLPESTVLPESRMY